MFFHIKCRRHYDAKFFFRKSLNETRNFTIHIRILQLKNYFSGSRGKGFLVLFMNNLKISTKNVYVTSENGALMNITTSPRLDNSLKSQIDRYVDIPSSQHIVFPQELELSSFQKEEKLILIETSNDVFVISHDDAVYSVGSTTHLPLHKLSTQYVVVSTEPGHSWLSRYWRSQLAVSAIEDNTTISITFKMKRNVPLRIDGNMYYNGDVFNISLERFQTYQIEHVTDLSGTFVESSSVIAVFSGNNCNMLENMGACDYLIEQLPPTSNVDNAYIVPPNMDDRDTVVRIISTENANITYMIGLVTQRRFLRKFNTFDIKLSNRQTCFIESNTPILVTAFGLHSTSSSIGDPSMTIVPGINQYLDYYKIVVPLGYDQNYVSVMIKESSKDSFRVNGTVIEKNDVDFEENVLVRNITYNVRSIRVAEGELTASTLNGDRFGLIFAGVTEYEAYGFSGNSLLL